MGRLVEVLYCYWRDAACAPACLLGFIFWPGPIKAIVTNEKTLKNDEKLCSDMEYIMQVSCLEFGIQ